MSEAVLDILQRIEQLTEEDQLLLEERLALAAEAEWRREANAARKVARHQEIDQAATNSAVEKARYGR